MGTSWRSCTSSAAGSANGRGRRACGDGYSFPLAPLALSSRPQAKMRTSDVIVVGGGVVGASVAYHLAKEGLSVTLFERGELAAQASGAAAGMLAPICESP